jgi:hypothetical protein
MEVNSDHVELIERMDEEVYSGEEITDLELGVKIEQHDEIENIKTENFEEKNYSEIKIQIIGEKRKNHEEKNLEIEPKKIKEEFVVFEELDDEQEIEEINFDMNKKVN